MGNLHAFIESILMSIHNATAYFDGKCSIRSLIIVSGSCASNHVRMDQSGSGCHSMEIYFQWLVSLYFAPLDTLVQCSTMYNVCVWHKSQLPTMWQITNLATWTMFPKAVYKANLCLIGRRQLNYKPKEPIYYRSIRLILIVHLLSTIVVKQ